MMCPEAQTEPTLNHTSGGGAQTLAALRDAAGAAKIVFINEPLSHVNAYLKAHPAEVGVLVMDGDRFVQLISREWTADLLARPYCRELFLERSLEAVLRCWPHQPLELAEATPIPAAMVAALARQTALRYQPIVVQPEDGNRWLLDVYSLLLGQCQLLETTLHKLEEQRRATQTAHAEREALHRQLVAASREAGRAEVATGILHNVGNVLNSIGVSVGVLAKSLQQGKIAHLVKSIAMFEEHRADLAAFLTADPRGVRLPGYLAKLACALSEQQTTMTEEVGASAAAWSTCAGSSRCSSPTRRAVRCASPSAPPT